MTAESDNWFKETLVRLGAASFKPLVLEVPPKLMAAFISETGWLGPLVAAKLVAEMAGIDKRWLSKLFISLSALSDSLKSHVTGSPETIK